MYKSDKTKIQSFLTVVYVAVAILIVVVILLIILPLVLKNTGSNSASISLQGNENSEIFLPAPLTEIYSKDTAIRLGYVANSAYYAYFNASTMYQWLTYSDIYIFNLIQFYSSDTQVVGFVANFRSEKELVISFTGTQVFNLPVTVIDDLLIGMVDFPPTGGKVSIGFLEAWESVKPDIWNRITSNIEQIWFAAHSLGGAIATIASADIKKAFPKIKIITYTYASPRVGNLDFVNGYTRLNIISNRIQNISDVIPFLPPNDVLGYVHVHTLILLHKYTETNQTLCIYDAKPPKYFPYDIFDWAYEHSLFTYLQLISTCTEKIVQ